ncbi:MAG: hypothetical protein HFH89_00435 [Lachnospiraceae bacterium]|nr:hypothetical protein [uncultured Acetatifactor sp.]MCI8286142.1 hypothetical protein [Lachnospiraceae bacterium]
MEKIIAWWKEDNRGKTLVKALFLALLPVFCCVVYCAAQGFTIGQVYLPASEWNDELFYYKQVEGIIHYGYPQGYFGFNESHALKLSFAAWSPVLVFPWIIWGLIFGWNLMSPIYCNIFLMVFCCFLFVWLVRPAWKQLGILALLFCLYTPFVRYMLSVMPEVICFSMLIIFYSLAVNYLRREKVYKLVLLFLMAGTMTLMRPYLALFLLLPAFLWIRKSGWKGAAGAFAVVTAVVGVYAGIKHYLGAEYFAPLFFTDWVAAFFEQGLLGGIRFTLGKLYYMGRDFLNHMRQGFSTGLASGAFFASYLVCMLVLAVQSIRDGRRLRRKQNLIRKTALGNEEKELKVRFITEVHLALSFFAMLFALLLMYKLTEGSKHLLTFMAAAIFITALMETKFYKKAAVLGVTFAYFFFYMGLDPYDYQVPFVREERRASLEEWEDTLSGRLKLKEENVPNYENVVIWVFNDTVEGTDVNTQWQLLYALPKGFGISCCMPDYVMEHFDTIQSRYLCVVPGGPVEEKCIRAGYEKITEQENAVLYQRY